MAKPTKAQVAERDEALAKLRVLLAQATARNVWDRELKKDVPTPIVYTVLRHVNRGGTARYQDLYAVVDGEILYLTGWAAHALGKKINQTHGGIDTGFEGGDALVYWLASRLYGSGYALHHERI